MARYLRALLRFREAWIRTSSGIRSDGYKKPAQTAERREILDAIAGLVELLSDCQAMEANADVLDAVVCVLAARDFLEGQAPGPRDADRAAREGWIWVGGQS